MSNIPFVNVMLLLLYRLVNCKSQIRHFHQYDNCIRNVILYFENNFDIKYEIVKVLFLLTRLSPISVKWTFETNFFNLMDSPI